MEPKQPRSLWFLLPPPCGLPVVLDMADPSFLRAFLHVEAAGPWTFRPSVTWGRLAEDPAFLNALKNTLVILLVQVPLMVALATVLAVLLNSSLLKARGIMLRRAGGVVGEAPAAVSARCSPPTGASSTRCSTASAFPPSTGSPT